MIQPRWQEISRLTARGMENTIASMQCKVSEAKAELLGVESAEVAQYDGEETAAFEMRKMRLEDLLKQKNEQVRLREVTLKAMMDEYEGFLAGQSILGDKTGSLLNVETLFDDPK